MNITKIKNLIPQSARNICHLFQAILANLIFGFPSRHIKVIGVTGTNGKTTTCQMIAKVLEEAGFKTALASTINFKIGEKEWVNKTKFTTLSSFAVQKFIRQAVKAKCAYLVLETSSHSLDQNRTWGVDYYAGAITNITREHLDYHKTIEGYRKAKMKLFKNVRVAVINLALPNPGEFLNENMDRAYGYSAGENMREIKIMTLKAEDIKLNPNGSEFQVNEKLFKLNIPGKFNIENALAAMCVGIAEGLKMKTMAEALEKINLIPGRMERVPNNKGLNIIIDYAVTPDSLEKLYELVNSIKNNLPLEKGVPRSGEGFEELNKTFKSTPNPSFSKGGEQKVISVFGACGERDRGKRPIMGGIVSRSADYIILTNEDPYEEDPYQIIDEVFSGIPLCHSERSEESRDLNFGIPRQVRDDSFCFTENVNLWKIMDRREAIQKALQMAKEGDYVIITGKGAEETMAIGKERIPWNDKQIILEELGNMN